MIKSKANLLLKEEKAKHQSEISQYNRHKQKTANRDKSRKEMENTIKREIEQLKGNMMQKIQQLIELNIDLDDLFYEMRDDEELKWENSHILEVEKSAICRQLKFRYNIGLSISERRKNIEIQTYNVDFLIE